MQSNLTSRSIAKKNGLFHCILKNNKPLSTCLSYDLNIRQAKSYGSVTIPCLRQASGNVTGRGRYRLRKLNKIGNKIFFQSLGCPRNWVDSEVMLGSVLHAGYQPTQEISEADVLVVNTCGFLKAARDESTSEIETIISTKKNGSKLIVTGCMINLHKDKILKSYPEIDDVLGSGSIDKIVNVIRNNHSDEEIEEKDMQRSFLENGDVPRLVATPKHYAYLKIAEGCRKRCSFCIIPKIKGPLRSKPESQIISEFRSLVANGSKEIILIAQDLGDYGKDMKDQYKVGTGLAIMLANLLDQIPEQDVWLRLMYLYPDEITDELISLIKKDRRICRYLDMPIQHINDQILKKMRRKTCASDIRKTIARLRQELPDIQIRTSLMVGFPGETEEQFQELVEFVKEIKLDNVGAFMYSNEEFALSSRLDGQISEDEKERRYSILMEAQQKVVMEKNMNRVQQKDHLDVVIEGTVQNDGEPMNYIGRYYGQAPDIDSQIKIQGGNQIPSLGERYRVEITDIDNYDLVGRFVERKMSN